MTQADYAAFTAEFARLSNALERFRQTPQELAGRADAYFHALKRFSLLELTLKADRWLERETQMPKPAEWGAVVATAPGTARRLLTSPEAREYGRAESLRWEETDLCDCGACNAAGCQHPPRFVPTEDADGALERVDDPIKHRTVYAGHWIHGEELNRWHAARERFRETVRALKDRPALREVGATVLAATAGRAGR